MKIKTETVHKLTITDIPSLDPIAVYMEDVGKGQGKIIITCFNESWSYYWGAMGENTLGKFFANCDTSYIALKLSPNLNSTIDDPENIVDHAKRHVIELRRNDDLDKKNARILYEKADSLYDLWDEFGGHGGETYRDTMSDIFGDEWYDCIPQKPNPKYEYLCRIINTVKEALKEHQ